MNFLYQIEEQKPAFYYMPSTSDKNLDLIPAIILYLIIASALIILQILL